METDSSVLSELKKLEKRQTILIVLVVFLMLMVAGLAAYIWWLMHSYQAKIDDAFVTIKKIDDIVNQISASYATYHDDIRKLFDTVNEIQSLVQKIKDTLSNIPFLNIG